MTRARTAALFAALCVASLGGCIGEESTSGPAENSVYAGAWVLQHAATTPPLGECAPDIVGEVKLEAPITVDASGHFTIPSDGEEAPATGTVSSSGAVNVILPSSPPCAAGSASGSCATTDSCAGNWSSNGQSGTWTMTRIPTGGYAGIWYLHHTLVVDDTTECGNEPVGVERTEGPIVVFADGHFTIPDDSENGPPTGTISPTGVVTVTLPGGVSGSDTCSAGTATGNCSSTSDCSGTWTQGGDSGTWHMTRTP